MVSTHCHSPDTSCWHISVHCQMETKNVSENAEQLSDITLSQSQRGHLEKSWFYPTDSADPASV